MNLVTLLEKQKDYFLTGNTKELSFRLKKLKKLREAILRYEPDILNALKKDLNKSEFEAYLYEIGYLLDEIKFVIKHLKSWMKPKKVKTALTHIGSTSLIYPEPYGVSLIIAPWNYPFQLQIAPLIGAIAAGNCAILKPSELTPHVSRVIAQMIEGIFEKDYVAVVEGGVETSTELLKLPFDHIFFTGSVAIGKVVMEAASKQLIPVTLELGGKSPTIVDSDANLDLAAKRIVWGKFTNAGQTCVAPDYLYVQEEIKKEFIQKLKATILDFYGPDPLENDQYGRIINDKHFKRLSKLMQKGNILIGGKSDPHSLKIAPTLIEEVTWDDPIMQEEIFGPILPIFSFKELEEVIQVIQKQPKPLALYYFSETEEKQEKVLASTSFGGGCINDVFMHVATPYLPFGGVGASGIGRYHGKYSFDCFSHEKSVLKQTTRFDFSFRYPNQKNGLKLIRKLYK